MNLIVIIADTFRADHLGCYGNEWINTPHLDRLAAEGVTFTNTYADGLPTIPMRRVFYTGNSILPRGEWRPLLTDDITVAQIAGEAGFTSGLIADCYHLFKPNLNFHEGFDSWEWIRGQETDKWRSGPRDRFDPTPYIPEHHRNDGYIEQLRQYLMNMQDRVLEEDYIVARSCRAGMNWLEQNLANKPFILWLELFDPHEPWDAPQWYEDMYDPGYKGVAYRYPIYGDANTYTKAELNHMRACYAGEASLVDRWVGFLLESIEKMGLMENTCVVFTADHGICVGDHGWTGKNAPPLYEEVAHTPLLVHTPGQTRSHRVKSLVQPVDLMPTFLDLAKTKAPKDLALDGVSLKKALDGKPLKTRDYAFSRGGKGLVVTGKDWSLVYPSSGLRGQPDDAPIPELFDLSKDPTQKKNVIKRNLPQARAMWDAYDGWLQAGGVATPTDQSPRP
jgi:arylsulfatase A-like enzyme